jgi:hypothetical protein
MAIGKKTSTVDTYVPDALKAFLKELAEKKKMSVSTLAKEILTDYAKKQGYKEDVDVKTLDFNAITIQQAKGNKKLGIAVITEILQDMLDEAKTKCLMFAMSW